MSYTKRERTQARQRSTLFFYFENTFEPGRAGQKTSVFQYPSLAKGAATGWSSCWWRTLSCHWGWFVCRAVGLKPAEEAKMVAVSGAVVGVTKGAVAGRAVGESRQRQKSFDRRTEKARQEQQHATQKVH